MARKYGADDTVNLSAAIAHDCPRIQKPSANIYDLCGVMFPELPKWF